MIKLTGEAARKYRGWLQMWIDRFGTEPTASVRLEAFICARSENPWQRPWWAR